MLSCKKCAHGNPDQASYCYFDGVALSVAAGTCAGRLHPAVRVSRRAGLSRFRSAGAGLPGELARSPGPAPSGRIEAVPAGAGPGRPGASGGGGGTLPGSRPRSGSVPGQAAQPVGAAAPAARDAGRAEPGRAAARPGPAASRCCWKTRACGCSTARSRWSTRPGSRSAPAGARQKLFQFGGELAVPIQVVGRRLRASNKPLEGKLLIESNGGSSAITLRCEVPIQPYAAGVLAGARSPRQIAEKAKLSPKEAAVEFEKGRVAQWYQDNGWTYPVHGPAASGLGAVQQFYEALGLTPPPRVAVRDRQVQLVGQPGQAASHMLEMYSEEKRPVYAHAVSDQPWLEVGRARLQGRVARIPLRVARVPDRPGETLHAQVAVTANGNQRFVVPVTLRVGDVLQLITAPPAAVGGRGRSSPGRVRPGSGASFNCCRPRCWRWRASWSCSGTCSAIPGRPCSVANPSAWTRRLRPRPGHRDGRSRNARTCSSACCSARRRAGSASAACTCSIRSGPRNASG